jgi:magnesium transporter
MTDREIFVHAIRRRLAGESSEPLGPIVGELRAEDIADLLREVPDSEVYDAWELLHAELPSMAVEVLPLLDRHDVSRVVGGLSDENVAEVLDELPSDDATYVLEAMPEARVDPVVAAMEAPEGADVKKRLEYPESSAGRFMSGEFIALQLDATAADAVRLVQEASDTVTVVYVYLGDDHDRLAGVVSLRRLLQVKPDRKLADLSPEECVSVSVLDDQEHVAQIVARHDFVAVPVLDEAGRLVGVVTHDDVIDVVREEATEDILAMAGTSSDEVINPSTWTATRLRLPWLATALALELLAVKVIASAEARLGSLFVALALFMPVISAMSGNVGVQASTLVVRGLATGRIRRHDALPMFWKEVRVALVVGGLFAVVLGIVASVVMGHGAAFSLVVAAGLIMSMLLASTFGSLVPIAFDRVGIDPAVATGPFVTTALDVLAFGTYLNLAAWLLK